MPFACADRCLPVLTHTALVSHSLHALHSLLYYCPHMLLPHTLCTRFGLCLHMLLPPHSLHVLRTYLHVHMLPLISPLHTPSTGCTVACAHICCCLHTPCTRCPAVHADSFYASKCSVGIFESGITIASLG